MRNIKELLEKIEKSNNPIVCINEIYREYGMEYLYTLLSASIKEGNIDLSNTIFNAIRLEGIYDANVRKMKKEGN